MDGMRVQMRVDAVGQLSGGLLERVGDLAHRLRGPLDEHLDAVSAAQARLADLMVTVHRISASNVMKRLGNVECAMERSV